MTLYGPQLAQIARICAALDAIEDADGDYVPYNRAERDEWATEHQRANYAHVCRIWEEER